MSRHHTSMNRSAWARIRRNILDRDGYRCRKCGKSGVLEVHHVKALDDGGTNELGNLLTLCRGCHIHEHRHRDPERDAWQSVVDKLN